MSEHLNLTRDGSEITEDQILRNFKDLHPPFSNLEAMEESSRCLYCYDAPCVKACPTQIDIPTFIQQIRSQNINGSARTILAANILGGTCARVCPTEILCQAACVKNHAGEEPIQIGQLQRFSVDRFFENKVTHPFSRKAPTGKKIAIIGAGPAGLSCAHHLALEGHEAVIFEARPKSGGLNEYGLAAYKMVDDFAQREVDFLLQTGGIEIQQGRALGINLDLEDLKKQYDAIFLAVGLGAVNDHKIEGEERTSVRNAIDFIEEIRQCSDLSQLRLKDEVLVIGGGNTAIDAAVQAKRLGARKVTMLYRRGIQQMSATQWELDLARMNDVHVEYWAKPVKIQKSEYRTEMVFERTRLIDEKLTGTGEYFSCRADLVLKAIGQKLKEDPLDFLSRDGGKIKINKHYETEESGIFAGGDCTNTGQDLTVQAVEDGKQAAKSIHRYLGGE